MCGIYCRYSRCDSNQDFSKSYNIIRHRGPDNTKIEHLSNHLFVFHRLAICGLDNTSNQPFIHNNHILICNGEIYNHKQLQHDENIVCTSNSDCEIIIHLYIKYGIRKTLELLDGVFAFVIYNMSNDNLIIARDPIGIRSLFFTQNRYNIVISSEAKGLDSEDNAYQFPPGFYMDKGMLHKYYEHTYTLHDHSYDMMLQNIRSLLESSVQKRMMSDRPIACLLSGGLDSTLITALVTKYSKTPLETYSIGLKGSTDLKYAKIAADYLDTIHHNIIVSEKTFLNAIDSTIQQIESFCTTTVRASVGNYLVSKFIRDNSNNRVIFCGDLSDELFGSYRGFQNTNSRDEFMTANVKMLEDVHYFDVLRSDKTISGASLEARVPFADISFVKYVMGISPEYKMFSDEKMEKYILRDAFRDLLPPELLWRRKEAFSDGVSDVSRSWFEIIREFVDLQISDEDYEKLREKYTYLKPYDKESLYYREIFEKYYPGKAHMIPYFWRHPFSENQDPSARLLDNY